MKARENLMNIKKKRIKVKMKRKNRKKLILILKVLLIIKEIITKINRKNK